MLDKNALEAAAKRWHETLMGNCAYPWDECSEKWRNDCRAQVSALIKSYLWALERPTAPDLTPKPTVWSEMMHNPEGNAP